MQSGYRADIGRNQMWSSTFSSNSSMQNATEQQFESGDTYTINHMVDGTFITTPENCETIQPTNPNNTNATEADEDGYTGNCCIRAYNFIIEDETLDKTNENNRNLAVSNANMQNAITNLKAELEAEIYGKDAPTELLSKSEASLTYETIANHTIDRNNFTDRLALKADKETTYTKTEVNSALSTKANAADVYTKAEVDTAISSGTSGKADTSSVYTKAETDTLLNAKADAENTYTKTQVYNKSEVYNTAETEQRITTLTTFENQGTEVVDYYTYTVINPDTGEEEEITVPVYDNETESTSFWDSRSGCFLIKTAVKGGTSVVKRIINRIFIEPKMKRIRTACLAATGALVGTKVVAGSLAFGVTEAIECTKGGDDDPGEIEFSDDYHGNRTITNMAHDSEYDTMTYVDDNQTKTLIPDSTVPTVQAIKSHHYTKTEVDNLISGMPAPDMSNYYNKTDADNRFINIDEPVELLKRSEVIPITATIPTADITTSNETFSDTYYVDLNSNYTFPVDGTKHIVSTLTVSVSSGNVNALKLQLYFALNNKAINYTNNGDGTFSLDDNRTISKNEGVVRIRYGKRTGAANVSFSITAVSISYDFSTTINEYYNKTETDSLIANKANVSDVYTKTESDNRYINIDEPVELIKKSEEIVTFIPTGTYTAGTADSSGINLCEQMIIESDEISFTATIQVQVSEGYDVSLLNIGMKVNNEYKYLDSEENGTFSGTLTFSNLTPGTTYTIMYGWKTTSGSVKFKITSATLSYSLNTSLGNYYSKKEVENLKKWSWANSSNTWTFEPHRNSGINGAYQNTLKMTEDGTTVIRMVPSGIYAETFSPESMIQFGKTITGGNVSGRWRSSIVGVANDNYNPTTYSAVDTDTIVPSLKYLNSNYYPKSYVDALEARIAALEASS